MGIRLKRFPQYRLDFSIYSGVITVEEVLRHFHKLDVTADWLSYFDATTDVAALDLGHFPVLKDALAAKEAERDSAEGRQCLLVNTAPINEDFVRFWCAYAAEGIAHAHQRGLCPSLEAAMAYLNLPSEARAAIKAEIAPRERVSAAAGRAKGR